MFALTDSLKGIKPPNQPNKPKQHDQLLEASPCSTAGNQGNGETKGPEGSARHPPHTGQAGRAWRAGAAALHCLRIPAPGKGSCGSGPPARAGTDPHGRSAAQQDGADRAAARRASQDTRPGPQPPIGLSLGVPRGKAAEPGDCRGFNPPVLYQT